MADLSPTIETNAQGPKKVTGTYGSIEQHPLPDQVEADKHLKQTDAVQKNHQGLRFVKLVPPGTI